MAKDSIFLAVVTLAAALAAFSVGGITAEDLNEEELGVLNHKGESFLSEKHLERNYDKDADSDTTNHWHQNEREKRRRRAMRKSKRWTDENKQSRRRIYSQDTMKRSRRRRDDVQSEDYLRKMKNYMKGDERRHERSFTTRRRQDTPDAGRGRGHRRSRESPDGRRRNTKKSRKDAQNRRREFPKNLHKKKSSKRRRIKKNLDNSKGGIGKGTKLKEQREKPGKGGKLAEKKPKAMTEEVKKKKKKIHSVPRGGKSTTSKRIKKVKKMKTILGKGGKKASPKGSCKVTKVVPSDDGNSAILFGYNMEKRGGCKMTFKGPKGSTLSLDCPQFQLNSEGCSQEGMEVYDKESKEKSEHCQTSGPKGWKSSGNVAVITFLREPSKGNCGRNFVCQISVTGSTQNVKMLGEQEDCDESFDLANGESAVIHSINGPGKRECKIDIKAPKGTYLNITCPLISLDGEYCGEEVALRDEGFDTYGYSYACERDKALSLVTETHMASIFHKREKDKKKVLCSAGFVCVASVVEFRCQYNTSLQLRRTGFERTRVSLSLGKSDGVS